MVYVGAQGDTASEMASSMHYSNTDPQAVTAEVGGVAKSFKNSPHVTIANKIYLNKGINLKPRFRDVAKDFDSETEQVDFSENEESANKINDWVELKTHNKIQNLVNADSLDGSTKIILVNAIHFKADWLYQFPQYRTRPSEFWISETEKSAVDMMHIKKDFRYIQIPSLKATAIELPYKDSDLVMLIILPNEKTGLAGVESGIESLDLEVLFKNMARTEVEVSLPKFKVEFEMKMKTPLQKMGMKKMFTADADFGNLLDNNSVQISDVLHKTFIEVNEVGTEAAAATVLFSVGSAGPGQRKPVVEFNVIRPFYYQILDSKHNAVFVGSVRNISK